MMNLKTSDREGDNALDTHQLATLQQIAAALAAQFGPSCEVVIHDLAARDPEKSIVYIVNGHVTGRRVGDGPSTVVMEQILRAQENPRDHLGYLTRTPDGKILKSSTVYIRDGRGRVTAILSINYDISALLMMENAIGGLVHTTEGESRGREERITVLNVSDLLDDLIEQSVALVGKPVALMNKEDKVRAIQFLSQHGAFLITKSGDKVAKYFGISKYTLYSYIDLKQEEKRHEQN